MTNTIISLFGQGIKFCFASRRLWIAGRYIFAIACGLCFGLMSETDLSLVLRIAKVCALVATGLVLLIIIVVSLLRNSRVGDNRTDSHARIKQDAVLYWLWFAMLNMFYVALGFWVSPVMRRLFGDSGDWVIALTAGAIACSVLAIMGVLEYRLWQTLGICWEVPVPTSDSWGIMRKGPEQLLLDQRSYRTRLEDEKRNPSSFIDVVKILASKKSSVSGRLLYNHESKYFKNSLKQELRRRGLALLPVFIFTSFVVFITLTLIPSELLSFPPNSGMHIPVSDVDNSLVHNSHPQPKTEQDQVIPENNEDGTKSTKAQSEQGRNDAGNDNDTGSTKAQSEQGRNDAGNDNDTGSTKAQSEQGRNDAGNDNDTGSTKAQSEQGRNDAGNDNDTGSTKAQSEQGRNDAGNDNDTGSTKAQSEQGRNDAGNDNDTGSTKAQSEQGRNDAGNDNDTGSTKAQSEQGRNDEGNDNDTGSTKAQSEQGRNDAGNDNDTGSTKAQSEQGRNDAGNDNDTGSTKAQSEQGRNDAGNDNDTGSTKAQSEQGRNDTDDSNGTVSEVSHVSPNSSIDPKNVKILQSTIGKSDSDNPAFIIDQSLPNGDSSEVFRNDNDKEPIHLNISQWTDSLLDRNPIIDILVPEKKGDQNADTLEMLLDIEGAPGANQEFFLGQPQQSSYGNVEPDQFLSPWIWELMEKQNKTRSKND